MKTERPATDHEGDTRDLIRLLAMTLTDAHQALIDARWQLATYRDRGSELQLIAAVRNQRFVKNRLKSLLSETLAREARKQAATIVRRDLLARRAYSRSQRRLAAEMKEAA